MLMCVKGVILLGNRLVFRFFFLVGEVAISVTQNAFKQRTVSAYERLCLLICGLCRKNSISKRIKGAGHCNLANVAGTL